ncbi:Hypp5836 [Branchiostoma lanceolatum]|uniref:Hypp5836 protein n=1 Tax=Branchiostoma lanceolatum TaxID=7740 RepID=A0A8J9W7N0_BRALA|nr:Hypp5836 [Branchiostoma lanceolatum]
MSPAVSVPRPGSGWSSRPPSVGSSRRSSLSVSVARLKSEFPILLPGFQPQSPARDSLTMPDVPEWGFYLGVDQSVKKLDLSPPDRPNRIEVIVYCGEDAIVRTFPAKKTLRDVYIWVRSTLTHAKIPPRLVLTSGGVQYPANGSGADTRLADLPNVFDILGTVQPPAEDEDDKLKVRVKAGMDTLVGKFDPKDAFKALYAWVRATLAFKKRPRAFVLKSEGKTYALTEENVEKMMQDFPDEFELVELKTHEIPGARLKRREPERAEPRLRYGELDSRQPAPPPPSRDRSPHPENRNLKTGLDVDLRKRPKTRRKDRDKPKGTKTKQGRDEGDSSTEEEEEDDNQNHQNAESEGTGEESDQFSSRAPPPPRLLTREKDDRKRNNKRRESTVPDSRNKRDGKNKHQDRNRHGNGTPDYLFDVDERLRGGNFLRPSGLQITIPSVHGLVSRFELPMDLRELDTLTPRQYLSKYCRLNKTRQLVYRDMFDKQDWRHAGSLTFKDVLKAVQELYERDASSARLTRIMELLDLDSDATFDRDLFGMVCALYDRLLLREHTARVEGVEQTEKEKLENADFTALKWKLHDREISGPLKALLHAL